MEEEKRSLNLGSVTIGGRIHLDSDTVLVTIYPGVYEFTEKQVFGATGDISGIVCLTEDPLTGCDVDFGEIRYTDYKVETTTDQWQPGQLDAFQKQADFPWHIDDSGGTIRFKPGIYKFPKEHKFGIIDSADGIVNLKDHPKAKKINLPLIKRIAGYIGATFTIAGVWVGFGPAAGLVTAGAIIWILSSEVEA